MTGVAPYHIHYAEPVNRHCPILLPDEFNAEFSARLRKRKTVLEIRDFLSGEFTPLPLSDVMAALRVREGEGSIRIIFRAGK